MAEGFIAKEFEEKVIQIKRVSKKTKGGNNISFTALVVVGNRHGRVGAALAKSKDVATAVQKGIAKAKEAVVDISITEGTLAHEVWAKYGAAKVLLKPAPEGSGIIAGGTIRDVLDLAGIKNISAKMLGSNNKLGNVRCTIKALLRLKA